MAVFSSCNFSKEVKKDLNTGLSARYNGFTIDDIYLTDGNGNRLNNNKVDLGTKLLVVATGVDYYAEKNGKYFRAARSYLPTKTKKNCLTFLMLLKI